MQDRCKSTYLYRFQLYVMRWEARKNVYGRLLLFCAVALQGQGRALFSYYWQNILKPTCSPQMTQFCLESLPHIYVNLFYVFVFYRVEQMWRIMNWQTSLLITKIKNAIFIIECTADSMAAWNAVGQNLFAEFRWFSFHLQHQSLFGQKLEKNALKMIFSMFITASCHVTESNHLEEHNQNQ